MAYPAASTAKPLRVLVVDDSAFMRRAIERMLTANPGITVVGHAADGIEAVKQSFTLRPDVITMDVEMPRMDGVTAVGEIMRTIPTPIVMVSTLTSEGTETAIRALEAGAVECIGKPSSLSGDLVSVSDALLQAVTRAREARLQRRRPTFHQPRTVPGATLPIGTGGRFTAHNVLVIGSSTGGPPALTQVIPSLPADIPAAVIVVQHMPAGFTAALARRLDSLSALPVAEAIDGEPVLNGRVYVAPGDYHLEVGHDRRIRLNQGPSLHGVRPSVDIGLFSVVQVYGSSATAAILTGMGKDGADGSARLEAVGGKVIAQDEASCVVYGMPRVTMERTVAARQVPIERVAQALVAALPPWRASR